MDDAAFDSAPQSKKNLRVYLINPPYENPWRTQGDYIEEQKQMKEAHELLKKSIRQQSRYLLLTFFIMIATLVSGIYYMQEIVKNVRISLEMHSAPSTIPANTKTEQGAAANP